MELNMKLLLLLISLNCFAEYEIKITPNDSTWAKSSIVGTDQVDAELKLSEFAKNSKAHTCLWDEVQTGSIATRIVKKNTGTEFEPVFVDVTEYCKPSNYTYTGSDVTEATNFEKLVIAASKNISCGKNVKAYVGAMNIRDGLTQVDIGQVLVDYSDVLGLFDGGALDTAITVINAKPVTAIMTQAKKDEIVAQINNCKVTWNE